MSNLVERLLAKDRRALSRLITLVENSTPEGREAVNETFQYTGRAQIVGITGPPGCGKSTLVDSLIQILRKRGNSVGVIAVDPSSPFTGGALLGDRIRMQRHFGDKEVFIRSMGSRGEVGGLSRATRDAVRLLDAFGKDIILVETVGAGQAEVEIVSCADTICVVQAPGLGDDIQAIKAGILEIGDIFIVNKVDRQGSEKTVTQLRAALEMADHTEGDWIPPIVKTIARDGDGVDEVVDDIKAHFEFLNSSGQIERNRKEQVKTEILEILRRRLTDQLLQLLSEKEGFEGLLVKVSERNLDPFSAAQTILEPFQLDTD